MTTIRFQVPRVEGGAALIQDGTGHIGVEGRPTRQAEKALTNRHISEAVFLTQQISAESGMCHALASVRAWEDAAGAQVDENGMLLRELLQSLHLLQTHLVHFYYRALPDYLPMAALAEYHGSNPSLRRVGARLRQDTRSTWSSATIPLAFTRQDADQLAVNMAQAQRVVGTLQRMSALVGGKTPMVMSIGPGGVGVEVTEDLVFRLDRYLSEVEPFVSEAQDDALLLNRTVPGLKNGGRGEGAFLSSGFGNIGGKSSTTLPAGLFREDNIHPLEGVFLEETAKSFYTLPTAESGSVMLPDPKKDKAYSWVKAPRLGKLPLEVGAAARLAVGKTSGYLSADHPALALMARAGIDPQHSATSGGRMAARAGEMSLLVDRAREILARLIPGKPAARSSWGVNSASGTGVGRVEAPAGTLQHKVWLDDGIITSYDIISPSAWNGSPADDKGKSGPLETALNGQGIDLSSKWGQRLASQIVHSFQFSGADAVE
ncbi:MAG: nickel-dependent hydrogenase large subunit [Deltaproteobacteria bacterium]|nr:nickel-dependent hydrogenase large subunit [Deltaproteobacteria bacterium]